MKKALIILSVLLGVSIALNITQCHNGVVGTRDGPLTDTIPVYDTIPYLFPVPVDSVVLRYETKTLPLLPKEAIEDTLNLTAVVDQLVTENQDSATVIIPITQKIYSDSTYRAYVSGYNPVLDSIQIFHRTDRIYIRSPTKQKRWGLGIQLGIGVTPARAEPYIGIGVSYNLLSF